MTTSTETPPVVRAKDGQTLERGPLCKRFQELGGLVSWEGEKTAKAYYYSHAWLGESREAYEAPEDCAGAGLAAIAAQISGLTSRSVAPPVELPRRVGHGLEAWVRADKEIAAWSRP